MAMAKVYSEFEVEHLLMRMEAQVRNTAGAVARDAAESTIMRWQRAQERRNTYLETYQPLSPLRMVDYSMRWDNPATATPVQDVAPPAAVAVVEMPDMAAIATLPIEVKQEDMEDMGKAFAMEVEQMLGYSNLRKEVQAPSRLRCVLAKLEIEVLNPEQVLAYKEQAKQHMKTAKKMSDPTWTVTPIAEYHQKVPHFVLSKALEIKKELPEAQFFVDHLQEDPFLIVTTGSVKDYGLTGRHGKLGERAKKGDDTMYLEVWNEKSFEEKL